MGAAKDEGGAGMDIVAYVENAGNAGFSSRPLNALDALVFSQLVYLPLELAGADAAPAALAGLPGFLAEVDAEGPLLFMLRHQLRLMEAAAGTRRFGPLALSRFVDEVDEEEGTQFAAMRVALPKGGTLVAFRGTDLSLAGWEEDFRIAYDSPVPAQRSAARYLAQTADDCPGDLYVCGHSKGGNLAVYAAAFCGEEAQTRVKRVFSFDAPGQTSGVMETGEYAAIRRRVRSFLPERSVVGVLLSQTRPYTVVACGAFGLLQHNPFNWRIEGGAFVKRKTLSRRSLFLDKSLNRWISAMTREEREQMTRAVFDVLYSPGLESFEELGEDWFSNVKAMWRAASQLPPHMKRAVRRCSLLLLTGAAEVITEDVREKAQGLHRRFMDFVTLEGDGEEGDGAMEYPE